MRGRWLILTLLLASIGAPARAFVPYSVDWNGRKHHPRWNLSRLPLPFVRNDSSLELLTNITRTARLAEAVEASAQAWKFGPIGVSITGTTSVANGGQDGVNLVTFAHTARNRDLVGDAYAVTPTFWRGEGGEIRIHETDVVFTTKHALSTDSVSTPGDIQETCTHEFGHAFGLLHSPIAASILYTGTGPYNAASVRGLAQDDVIGASWLYRTDPDTTTGSITGRVTLTNGRPVLGAHVAAIDADGVVQVGGLSDVSGAFELPLLRPSMYQVSIEPLSAHSKPSDVFSDYHMKANTSFLGTFAGGNRTPTRVEIVAGRDTTPLVVQVADRKPARFVRSLYWWNGQKWQFSRGQLRPGEETFLVAVGPALNTAALSSFSFSGSDVRIDYGRVELRAGSGGGDPSAVLPVTVSSNPRVGPRSLFVDSGDELAVMSGAIEIIR
jgi:hypothetical protein